MWSIQAQGMKRNYGCISISFYEIIHGLLYCQFLTNFFDIWDGCVSQYYLQIAYLNTQFGQRQHTEMGL